MRFLLKATIPTESGNKAIMDGTLAATIQQAVAELKPEAAYFIEEAANGPPSSLSI